MNTGAYFVDDALNTQHKHWVANDLANLKLARIKAGDKLRVARERVKKLEAIYEAAVNRSCEAEWAAKQEVR